MNLLVICIICTIMGGCALIHQGDPAMGVSVLGILGMLLAILSILFSTEGVRK